MDFRIRDANERDSNAARRGIELALELHEKLCTIDCSEVKHLDECARNLKDLQEAEIGLEAIIDELSF